jgi:hypothetical protein
MINRDRIIRIALFFLVLALSACEAKSIPETGNQSPAEILAVTDSPVNNMTFDTPVPRFSTQNLGTVAVEFLADNSGSVGECDNAKMAYDYINFLSLNLFQQIPFSDDGNLYVGIGQFGDKYVSNQPLTTDFKKLSEFQQPENRDMDTKFIDGIAGALANIDSSVPDTENTKKILILLTDGKWESESPDGPNGIFQHLRDAIVVDKNLSVYINLLCSDSSNPDAYTIRWQENIDTSDPHRIISLTADRVGQWFGKLVADLQPFMKQKINYLDLSTGQDFSTAGSTNLTTLSFWSFDTNMRAGINENSSQIFSLASKDTNSIKNESPLIGCKQHKYSVSLSSGGIKNNQQAFLLINEKTFENVSLNSDIPAGSINNNSPTEINVTARELNYRIGLWRDCFQINLHNDALLSVIKNHCDANGSLVCSTSDGNALFAKFSILPLSDLPDDILPIPVDMDINMNIVGNNPPLKTETVAVPVSFQPLFSPDFGDQQSRISLLDTSNVQQDAILSFNYVSSSPEIFLITTKDKTQISEFDQKLSDQYKNNSESTWEACPNSTNTITKANDNSGALAVHLIPTSNEKQELQRLIARILPIDNPRSASSIYPHATYKLQTFQYVLSHNGCGYGELIFIWQAQGNYTPTTWSCNLLSMPVSCSKIDPVIVR